MARDRVTRVPIGQITPTGHQFVFKSEIWIFDFVQCKSFTEPFVDFQILKHYGHFVQCRHISQTNDLFFGYMGKHWQLVPYWFGNRCGTATYELRIRWIYSLKSKQMSQMSSAKFVHTTSGDRPRPLSSLTLFWVGLVLCSPFCNGIRLTCTLQKFSRLTLNWNCRKASTNGILSMSPMVPPSWQTKR